MHCIHTKDDVLSGKDKDIKIAIQKCIDEIEKDKTIVGFWAFKPKEDAQPTENAN